MKRSAKEAFEAHCHWPAFDLPGHVARGGRACAGGGEEAGADERGTGAAVGGCAWS